MKIITAQLLSYISLVLILILTTVNIAFSQIDVNINKFYSGLGIPIVRINLDSNPIQEDVKIVTTMNVINDTLLPVISNVFDPFTFYTIGIEYRGDTSATKRSYSFETREPDGTTNLNVNFFNGWPSDNDYILNGPYFDKSLIRNFLAYNLTNKMGTYASRTQFVDLFINLEYQGIYVLVERIKSDGGRVDIKFLDSNDNSFPQVTGGYIIEVDETEAPNEGFESNILSSNGNVIEYLYSTPKKSAITPQQKIYIENYINNWEAVMDGPNFDDPLTGYPVWIDVESFADFIIMQELTKNTDGYRSSSYFYKDRANQTDTLLHAGPVWDFNLAFGNTVNYNATDFTGWQWEFSQDNPTVDLSVPFYWEKLMNTPAFRDEVACRWNQFRLGPLSNANISNLIDSTYNYLLLSANDNFATYINHGLDDNLPPCPWTGWNEYEDATNQLESWILNRVAWLDSEFPGQGFDVFSTTTNTSVCPGDQITLTVDGGSPNEYVWYSNDFGIIDGASSNTLIVNPLENDTYTVYGTNSFGCTDTAKIEINLSGFSSTTGGPNMKVCPGDSVQLAASGGTIDGYLWDSSPYLSDLTIPNPWAFPPDTTFFPVQIISAASGCVIFDTVKVSVFPSSFVDATNDTTTCLNSVLQLNATGDGDFTWTSFPTDFSLINPTIPNPQVVPQQTTMYFVELEDMNGCKSYDSLTVTVETDFESPYPALINLCAGVENQIECPTNIQSATWSPITNLDNPNSICPVFDALNDITYTVVLTTLAGCNFNTTVEINLLPGSPINAGEDESICLQDSTTLVTNGGSTNFMWTPSDGLSNPNVSNPSANPTETTTYTILSSGNGECTSSDQITITVLEPTLVYIDEQNICIGESIELTTSGANSYNWTDFDNSLSCNNCTSPIVNPTETANYILEVNDLNNCFYEVMVTVNVDALAFFTGDSLFLCNNETAQLFAAGGTSYSWFPDEFLSCNACPNPIVLSQENAIETYIVTVIGGADQCDGIATQTVSYGETCTAGSDITICLGGSGNLNSTCGVSWQWFPATGLSCTDCQNPTVTTNTEQTYTVTITDSIGCEYIDEVTVFVQAELIADAGEDQIVCNGSTVNLLATGGVNYEWSPTLGLSCSDCPNPIFDSNLTGVLNNPYSVTVSSGDCSDVATLNIEVIPLFTASVIGLDEICEGDSITLEITAGDTFIWTDIDGNVLNNNATFVTNPNDTTTYFIEVLDENGCAIFLEKTIIVNPVPNVDAGSGYEICINDSLNLNGIGDGNLVWTPNLFLENDTLGNTLAFPTTIQQYTLTATNSFGCDANDVAIVFVNELPNINITADTIICLGSSILLNSSGGNIYSWFPGESLNDSTLQNPTATPQINEIYNVTVTNNNSCINTASVQILTSEPFVTTISNDEAICSGDSLQLLVTDNPNYTYLWNPTTGLNCFDCPNPMASPNIFTNYSVIISDGVCENQENVIVTVNLPASVAAGADQNLCSGESSQLDGYAQGDFYWSPSTFLSDSSILNPMVINPSSSITYILFANDDNNCSAKDSINITVQNIDFTNIEDIFLCYNESFQLAGNSETYNYTWSPPNIFSNQFTANPVITTNITTSALVTIEENGCEAESMFNVNIYNPSITSTFETVTICAGGSTVLNAFGGVSYQWSSTTFLDDTLSQFPICTPTNDITYTVDIIDENNCITTQTFEVIVGNNINSTVSENVTICSNNCYQLFATGGTIFNWTSNNINAGINNSAIFNPTVCPDQNTTYEVEIQDGSGCISNNSVDVIVSSDTLEITISNNETICLGGSTNLESEGIGTIEWFPTTGLSCTNCPNPIANPTESTNYTVTYTQGDCFANASIFVTVDSFAVASTIIEDFTACSNQDFELSATGGDFYNWSPSNVLNNPFLQNPTANIEESTTFFVTITDANNCFVTNTVNVSVNQYNDILTENFVNICEGESYNLDLNHTISYTITPSNGFITNGGDVIFNPTNNTNYTIEALFSDGCVLTETLNFTVPQFSNTTITNDTTLCVGAFLNLTASGGVSYSWFPTTNLTNPNSSSTNVNLNTTSTYNVEITDANGCTKTESITINVIESNFGFASANVSICEGGSTQLFASEGNSYSWIPNINLSDASIANPIANPSITTTYTVTITNEFGCVDTENVMVTVGNSLNVSAGPNVTVCENGNGIQLFGAGGTSFSWQPSLGLSDTVSQNPIANPSISTAYTLTSTDGVCTNMETVFVSVLNAPNLNLNEETLVCPNNPTPISPNLSTINFDFEWSPANVFNNSTAAFPSININEPTLISLTITDNNGCSATDFSQINLHESVLAISASNSSVCEGEQIQLDLVNESNGIVWFPNYNISNINSNSVNVFPEFDITYYATATNNLGCEETVEMDVAVVLANEIIISGNTTICKGDSIQLFASGADSFNWSPNISIDSVNVNNPTVNPESTQIYTLTAQLNGCEFIKEVEVTVINTDEFYIANNDFTACAGSQVSLTANNGAHFEWFGNNIISNDTLQTVIVNLNVADNYFVIISDAENFCSKTDSIFINVGPAQNGEIELETIMLCLGSTLEMNVINANAQNYNWSPSNYFDNNLIASPTFTANQIGAIDITVLTETNDNCFANYYSNIEIVEEISVGVNSNSLTICKDASIQLTAFGAAVFSWSPAIGLNTTSNNIVIANPLESTIYTVTGFDNAGNCESTNQIALNLSTIEDDYEIVKEYNKCIDDELDLFASGGTGYNWEPAILLTNNNLANPTTNVNENTIFTVTISDAAGCFVTDSVTVSVKECVLENIPNMISPNGDDKNEYWIIDRIENYPNNNVVIFNRWGQKVFDEQNYQNNWNGRYNGEPLPEATYYYYIYLGDDEEKQSGTITIIR